MVKRIIVAIVSVFVPSYIYAYSLVYDSNVPISIHDINVNGSLYDVNFIWTTFEQATYPEKVFFWTSKADAVNAANSVLNILNTEHINYVLQYSTGRSFAVAYDYNAPWTTFVAVTKTDVWDIERDAAVTSGVVGYTEWALATSTPVPDPSTSLLLGSGLLGVAILYRKKD